MVLLKRTSLTFSTQAEAEAFCDALDKLKYVATFQFGHIVTVKTFYVKEDQDLEQTTKGRR